MSNITQETQAQVQAQARPSSSSKRATRKRDSSTFHGVRKRSWGRYVSEIRLPGQKTRIWLGSFGSAEMAARAYDSAAYFLKGNSASLNFPEEVESLPRPVSSSRRDIQSAAAKAALQEPSRNQEQEQEQEQERQERSYSCSSFSSVETKMEWWTTTSFLDMEEDDLLVSPPKVGPTFEDLTWNEVFNFNDDQFLAMESTL